MLHRHEPVVRPLFEEFTGVDDERVGHDRRSDPLPASLRANSEPLGVLGEQGEEGASGKAFDEDGIMLASLEAGAEDVLVEGDVATVFAAFSNLACTTTDRREEPRPAAAARSAGEGRSAEESATVEVVIAARTCGGSERAPALVRGRG